MSSVCNMSFMFSIDRVQETIAFPLYYTGLTDSVSVSVNEGSPTDMRLERDYFLILDVAIGAENMTTVVFT